MSLEVFPPQLNDCLLEEQSVIFFVPSITMIISLRTGVDYFLYGKYVYLDSFYSC